MPTTEKNRSSVLPSDRLHRDTVVIWRPVKDEIVILNQDGTELTSLNETAAVVWKLLDGEQSVERIAETLAEQYANGIEQTRQDVIELCEGLLKAGLAHREANGQSPGRDS